MFLLTHCGDRNNGKQQKNHIKHIKRYYDLEISETGKSMTFTEDLIKRISHPQAQGISIYFVFV